MLFLTMHKQIFSFVGCDVESTGPPGAAYCGFVLNFRPLVALQFTFGQCTLAKMSACTPTNSVQVEMLGTF